jgi:hypothetical protein
VRSGVGAGQTGELAVEGLEGEVEADRLGVLDEQRARDGGIRVADRQLRYSSSSAIAGGSAASPSIPARVRAPNMRPRAGCVGANALSPIPGTLS